MGGGVGVLAGLQTVFTFFTNKKCFMDKQPVISLFSKRLTTS
jgi:hypothetical protein